MSDWSNGLQLPDDKPLAEKPMPLHEEKQPSPEVHHEHPHEVRHERVFHSEKRRVGKGKASFITLSQAQVGIWVAAVLVVSLTAVLAYRSTDTVRKLEEGSELSQQNKRSLEPGVWVAEKFVATFKVVSPWEVVLSDTDMWVASYKEEGITGQLEVSIQDSSFSDPLNGTPQDFAGIQGLYSQTSQLTFDGGSEVRRVTSIVGVLYNGNQIGIQLTLQGSEDVLTDEKVADLTTQFKQFLSDAKIE